MAEEKLRALKQHEWDFAWEVYWDSLPVKSILISNQLNWLGRAAMETMDKKGIGTGDYYILKMGPEGYKDATSTNKLYASGSDRKVCNVFIHELAHVWQAWNGYWVQLDSAVSQGCAVVTDFDYTKAYDYEPGKAWNKYNVEQQASIVEDWFREGKKKDSELYTYMVNHIWNY